MISTIVTIDYERVNGIDVCQRTCQHRNQFREWVLWFQKTGHECSHFGVRLETFRDGDQVRCKRADECRAMERNCEQFDDAHLPNQPLATTPWDWRETQAAGRRNVVRLPVAVERPSIAPRKLSTEGQ